MRVKKNADGGGLHIVIPLAVIIIFLFVNILSFKSVSAAEEDIFPVVPANRDLSAGRNTYISLTDTGYMLVYTYGEKINVLYLGKSFEMMKKMELDMELPDWGGFYAGADAYYVAEGKHGAEMGETSIRVIRYDREWHRLGAADFPYNAEYDFINPFTASGTEMLEKDGLLYLVAGYKGSGDSEGRLLLEINEAEMTGRVLSANGVSSFSKSHHMIISDNTLYLLEKNGRERRADLTAVNGDFEEVVTLLSYGGRNTSGYYLQNCYASVDSVEMSDTHILTVGTSIDQSLYDTAEKTTAHNIYLTATPKDEFAAENTTFTWLTEHKGDGAFFSALYLLKVSENRYLVLWQEGDDEDETKYLPDSKGKTVHYRYVDGSGNVIGEEKEVDGFLSTCRPMIANGGVVWCTSVGNKVAFARLNLENDHMDWTEYHVAGDEITWTLEDGILTLTGNGVVNVENTYKIGRLSSINDNANPYSYMSWIMPENPVKKIVFSEGITDIVEGGFKNTQTLQEIILPSTMECVRANVFGICSAELLVYFKSADCTVDKNAIWHGWYFYSDPTYYKVTFACLKGSVAEAFAEENNINCQYIYLNPDLTPVIGVIKENGEWMLFDENGFQVERIYGWHEVAGKKYYFDQNGILTTGWKKIYSQNYHFSEETAALDVGLVTIGNKTYYFDEDGTIGTSWKQIGEEDYYFGNDGVMRTGWIRVAGKYYYMKKDGAMLTGWLTEKGKTYYMNNDGVMMTGTVVVDGETCVFAKNGMLITRSSETIPNGWKQMGDQWAFFRSGKRLTGWQKIGGKYYYFELDGIMTTGWRYLKTKWYYLDPVSGAMKTGWLKKGGKWYFLDPGGYMVTGTRVISGKRYIFGSNGVCQNP